MSDPIILVGVGILVLALIALVFVLAMKPAGGGADFASLEGRVAQVADSQMTAHAQLSERLQSQERALARAVEERLEVLGRRVGDSLQKNSELTHSNLADLKTLQKEPAPKTSERRRRLFESSAGYLQVCRDTKPE